MWGSGGEDSDEVARMCLVIIEMRVQENIEDDFTVSSWTPGFCVQRARAL